MEILQCHKNGLSMTIGENCDYKTIIVYVFYSIVELYPEIYQRNYLLMQEFHHN